MDKDFKKLVFRKKKFDAVICLDANLPDFDIFKKIKDLPLLAADGAAIKLYKMGIIPDFVIGDLDSFYKSPISEYFDKNSIIEISEQDTNDFEKVLKFADEKGYKNLLIMGFHGGELEHTLNNWSVFRRFSTFLNLVILDESRYGFSVCENLKVETEKLEMISLIPQPKVRLTSKNLKWELDSDILELGLKEGARNMTLETEIALEIHSGQLLFFMNERLPYCFELI